MKFTDKSLLLFDFDGTLIDSVPDLALAVNHTLKSIGRPVFDESVIRVWIGNGAQTLVKRALSGKVDIDDTLDEKIFQEALKIFLDFYANNLCNRTKTFPNVLTTLKTLKERNYRLAIVTNKPFDFIEPILEALELSGLFELCIGGDTLPMKKPHPQPLLYICEQLHVSAEKTLMIGDSKNDILAAQAAFIDSIGVSYGYNYDQDIRVYNPDLVIEDFTNLLKSLP